MQNSRLIQLQELLKSNPDDPFLHYATGLEYQSLGQTEEAVEIFKKLISRNPDYLPVYYTFGLLLLNLGQTDESREILAAGISLAQKTGERKTLGELNLLMETIDD